MDLEFKKKIEERFKEIPEALAKAIKASGWEGIVFDIGRRHALHVDTIGDLQNELILVLTGITHPDEFHRIVIEELGIPEDKADVVIEEINTQVNNKIRDELKAVMEENSREESIETDAPQSGLQSSEKSILRSSGIKLGDEVDEPVKPEPAPSALVPKVEPKPENKQVATNLAEPAVFKTRVTAGEIQQSGKAFSDPYREPVE